MVIESAIWIGLAAGSLVGLSGYALRKAAPVAIKPIGGAMIGLLVLATIIGITTVIGQMGKGGDAPLAGAAFAVFGFFGAIVLFVSTLLAGFSQSKALDLPLALVWTSLLGEPIILALLYFGFSSSFIGPSQRELGQRSIEATSAHTTRLKTLQARVHPIYRDMPADTIQSILDENRFHQDSGLSSEGRRMTEPDRRALEELAQAKRSTAAGFDVARYNELHRSGWQFVYGLAIGWLIASIALPAFWKIKKARHPLISNQLE